MTEDLRTRAADPMDRLRHDANDPNPCPPLTAGEYDALKQSIAQNGLTVPVLVSAGPACEGQTIDGFHRSRICAELGIPAATYAVPCATELEFRIRQITTNLERRQLSTAQRAMMAARLLPLYEERARGRQAATQFGGERTGALTEERGKSAALAASAAGVSERTVQQMKAVLDKAPELVAQIESGQKSIKAAYATLRPASEQAALDASLANEAKAAAEITETVAMLAPVAGSADVVLTDARERAAGDAVRMAVELDRHVREHGLTDQDLLEYRSRPHTFTGTARRLADWLDLAASALELNR